MWLHRLIGHTIETSLVVTAGMHGIMHRCSCGDTWIRGEMD